MSLPHLILGLLYRKPDSGYDLNKRFERTVAHFWTTDQSQIYRTLYKLRDKDWVKVETVIQDGNPNKKVYSLTAEGHEELVNWLQTPLEEGLVIRDAETGQIYFGEAIGAEKMITVQQHYIEKLREKVAIYQSVEGEVFGNIDFNTDSLERIVSHATLQYGIRVLSMEIEWREELIQRIQEHHEHKREKGN